MSKQKYNRYQIPPDWSLATKHMRATRPGHRICISQSDLRFNVCPCCSAYVDKFPVSYFQSDRGLHFLGEGLPLLYNTLKVSCIMLLLLLLDSAAIQTVVNFNSNFCDNQQNCDNNTFNLLAYVEKQTTVSKYRTVIRVCGFVGQLFLLIWFRDAQMTISTTLEELHYGISDYSLRIEGIPRFSGDNQTKIANILRKKEIYGKEPIEKGYSDEVSMQKHQIQEVVLFYDLSQYYSHEKELKTITAQKVRSLSNQDYCSVLILDAEEKQIQAKIHQLVQNMPTLQKKYFIGQAIVVFNELDARDSAIQYLSGASQARDSIIKNYYPNYDTDGGGIRVTKAGQPNQIIWQNYHLPQQTRVLSIVVGWVITIVLMFGVALGTYFLIKYNEQLVSQDDGFPGSIGIGIGIAFLVTIVNQFVVAPLLHIITQKWEKHREFASLQFSFALKHVISTFFTTSVMVLLIQAIFFSNYVGKMGLVSQETLILLVNAYFSALVRIVNPSYIIYWIRRRVYYGSQSMTQSEANQIMQYPEYNIGERYGEVIKMLWFSFFYSELIPAAPAFFCSGIFLYCLADRYALLRKSSITRSVSSVLSKQCLILIECTIVLKPLGEFLFEYLLRGNIRLEAIIMMAIGVVFIVLPKNGIISCCWRQSNYRQIQPFQEVRNELKDNYSTYNPIGRYQNREEIQKEDTFVYVRQQKPESKELKLMQDQRSSNISEEVFLNQQARNGNKGKRRVTSSSESGPRYTESSQSGC